MGSRVHGYRLWVQITQRRQVSENVIPWLRRIENRRQAGRKAVKSVVGREAVVVAVAAVHNDVTNNNRSHFPNK